MTDYKVQLSVFEGPLDLLLYLIKKEEVDIYEVNLTKIATQFIAYVEMMRRLDLDVAGEFLVMAATLMYIKSRELLPVDQQTIVEEDEDQIDPRWDLIRQLVEYKKFKDMAAQLHGRELAMDAVFGRQPGQVELPEPDPEPPHGVSLFDLIQAVSAILKRFQETEKPGVIAEDKWTVSEKIQLLMEMIHTHTVVKFSELFAAARSRSEVIATFLAMLELTRMKKLRLAQSEVFGEIEISAAPAEAAAAAVTPPAEPTTESEEKSSTTPPPVEESSDEDLTPRSILKTESTDASAEAQDVIPTDLDFASSDAAPAVEASPMPTTGETDTQVTRSEAVNSEFGALTVAVQGDQTLRNSALPNPPPPFQQTQPPPNPATPESVVSVEPPPDDLSSNSA